ncbi:MAG: large-conductance mechanosensitive channel protein [Segetibacter sp.]|nr:large-conductance mechanosensitive channel protein [Segetibacter sp.]
MSFTKEFREFAVKGNVMDLAVGVIIGAAFARIVNSLVTDIVMPIAGIIVGPQGFKNSYTVLGNGDKVTPGMSLEDARTSGANILAWGNFLSAVLDFLIIAFIIFMLVKALNRMRRKEEIVATV